MIAAQYFEEFLIQIRLPDEMRQRAQRAHTRLRTLIEKDPILAPIVIATFLQGSYKRHTGVRPKAGERPDVDVVVVTNIDRSRTTPAEALNMFKDFLDKHYPGSYRAQGRSWRVIDNGIELDLVPTSAASAATSVFLKEAANVDFLSDISDMSRDLQRIQKLREADAEAKWRSDTLYIPDREAKVWRETNPLAQIEWTILKNDATGGHYVNIVKTMKWWRKTAYEGKHPKGYPLEHLVGFTCPEDIDSIAAGITRTAESIVTAFAMHRATNTVPSLQDHGVRNHNVLARLDVRDFITFYDEIVAMARDARTALDDPDLASSVERWRAIFGDAFPEPPKYTARTGPTSVVPGRFA